MLNHTKFPLITITKYLLVRILGDLVMPVNIIAENYD